MTYPSGATYSGSFNYDDRCGDGIMKWPNEFVYEGQWSSGKPKGIQMS